MQYVFAVYWKPSKDLLVVALSGLLIVGKLYTATVIIESDVWGGMACFALSVAFRLTMNIFILDPIFQPMRQLVTLINDGLKLPLLASLGFIEVLIVMLILVWLAGRYLKIHPTNNIVT